MTKEESQKDKGGVTENTKEESQRIQRRSHGEDKGGVTEKTKEESQRRQRRSHREDKG